MMDLKDGESIEVEGSKGARYVLTNKSGTYSCTCPSWQRAKEPRHARTCKHLKALRGELAERKRLKDAPPPSGPSFCGQSLDDLFRSDLLDLAEQQIEDEKFDELEKTIDKMWSAYKRGEDTITTYAPPGFEAWLTAYLARFWAINNNKKRSQFFEENKKMMMMKKKGARKPAAAETDSAPGAQPSPQPRDRSHLRILRENEDS